jgi:hypothetical protein
MMPAILSKPTSISIKIKPVPALKRELLRIRQSIARAFSPTEFDFVYHLHRYSGYAGVSGLNLALGDQVGAGTGDGLPAIGAGTGYVGAEKT